MATYTQLTLEQASERLCAFGLDAVEIAPIERGTVNSNYRVETGSGRSVFVRIYEERDRNEAEAEARLLEHLASASVPTPCPMPRLDGRGFTVEHVANEQSRPLAVFPWRAGEILCQRLVSPEVAHRIGALLARTHLAGSNFREERAGRYGIESLRGRLETISRAGSEELRAMAPRIEEKLARAVRLRDPSLPSGLVHGDLFRDNVLWDGEGRVTALLDFESACEGSFAYDLMVTVLAWCYGDDLELDLVAAMFEGYQSVRPLEAAEKRALKVEGELAALRFTITRITDVAMRAQPGEPVVKHWQRFWARHARIEELGVARLAELVA